MIRPPANPPRSFRTCPLFAGAALLLGIALCALPSSVAARAADQAAAKPADQAPDRNLADREEDAVRAAVARVAPSVVRIQTVGGLEEVEGVLQGTGPSTGLVVSPEGYIISSAYNFARRPSAILVSLPGRDNIPAKLIATDHTRALVLLKIDLKQQDGQLVVPEAAPPGSARPGAWAVAVGRTFESSEPNVSVGIVSAVGRIWGKAVQTDAKISPANYGGPLIDLHGRVIGVLVPMSPMASDVMAGSEWYDSGIGFAIPLTDIEKILPELTRGQDLRPGLMGVSIKGRDLFGTPPVIAACPLGGPAYEAGIRPGDRIVAIGGHEVVNQAQLRQQIGPLYAGDPVSLSVLRGAKRIEISLKLTDKLPPFEHPFLGVLPLRDPRSGPGVVIRYVYPLGPAEKAGVRVGDRLLKIDGRDVADSSSARDLLNTLAPEQQVPLVVERGKDKLTLSARLSRLPVDIPDALPPAGSPSARHADAAPGPAAAQGVVEIKIPEMKNHCFAYVPPRSATATPGVLIWLSPAGKIDKDKVLGQWKEACDANDLILLVPQPRDADRWQSDEVEFIGRALDRLEDMVEVDPARVVALGQQGGGTLALLLAFEHPGVVQGVAAVDAALPASVSPAPVEPTVRLAVLFIHGPDGPAALALGTQLDRLRRLKYPVTELKLDHTSRFLDDAQRSRIVRWVDSLDRL